MKRCTIFCLMAALVTSLQAEMLNVIRITSLSGENSYEVMSVKAYSELSSRIRAEKKLFKSAVGECVKAWTENGERKNSFPVKALKPRSISKAGGVYMNREKTELDRYSSGLQEGFKQESHFKKGTG